jgi:hypothetical protein
VAIIHSYHEIVTSGQICIRAPIQLKSLILGTYITYPPIWRNKNAQFHFCSGAEFYFQRQGPAMSGRIIHFRDFRRVSRTSDQCLPDPRWDIASQPESTALDPAIRRKRVLRLQVARIGRLLDELEELTSTSEGHGLAIVGQSRAAIKKARETLQQWPEAERNAQRSSDSEDDPQPEVDGEMLERMYQSLNSDA